MILIIIASLLCLSLVLYLIGVIPFLLVCLFLFFCFLLGNFFKRKSFFLTVVIGMQMTALLLFLIRFFHLPEWPILIVVLLVSLYYFFQNEKKISFYNKRTTLFLLLLFLLSIILISGFMKETDTDYYFLDDHHPIYELSIARSTDISVPLQDLSYFGKPLQFHFFSSLLSSFLTEDLKIDPITVAYRTFPLLAVFLFAPLLLYLLSLLNIKRKRACLLMVLFSSPFIIPISKTFSSFPEIFKSLTITPSYTMGYLGFLALLIVIIESIRKKKYYSLLIVILSVSLLMSKGSFFIPLALGVGTWSLFELVKKNYKAVLLPISMFIFSVPFGYFLSNAHVHNQWILVPDRLIFRRLPMFIPSLLSYPLIVLISPFLFLGFLGFLYYFSFFKKKKDSIILLITIIMLVGCTLPLFITEATEGNSRQFLYPSYILLFVLLFKWTSHIILTKKRRIIFAILLLVSFIPFSMEVKLPKEPSYDKDLIFTLSFIKENTKKDDIVLFGRHYEAPNWEQTEFIVEWDYKSFVRTAISGRQTLIEDFKYRGIGMEPDYKERALDNFKFFYNAIKERKGWDKKKGFVIPISKREERVNQYKSLWLGDDENWFSIRRSVPLFLEENWNLEETDEFMTSYLSQVDYVLFERGEKPKDSLGLVLIFEQGEYSFYAKK